MDPVLLIDPDAWITIGSSTTVRMEPKNTIEPVVAILGTNPDGLRECSTPQLQRRIRFDLNKVIHAIKINTAQVRCVSVRAVSGWTIW